MVRRTLRGIPNLIPCLLAMEKQEINTHLFVTGNERLCESCVCAGEGMWLGVL